MGQEKLAPWVELRTVCERVGGNRALKAACSVTCLLSPRDEIAGCIEKAYEKILFTEATRILFFTTPKKMTDYAKKRGWVLGLNNYYSFASQQQKPEDTTIPSTELAKQVIEYARQLEMIV